MSKPVVLKSAAMGGAVVALALMVATPLAWGAVCTVTALPVAFGIYNPLSVPPNLSTGSVTVICLPVLVPVGESYTVGLSTGGSSSFAARRLVAGANMLQYQLYADAPRSTVWGDGSVGSSTVAGSFSLSVLMPVSATHIVYARMPAHQSSAAAGAYSDTIMVTVTY